VTIPDGACYPVANRGHQVRANIRGGTMAKLDEAASLEAILDYLAQARAGLGALDELAPLAGPFETLTIQVQNARDKRDAARWKVLGKSARVRVFDARWDTAVKKVSAEAFHLAGKDAGKDPYNALFGTVKADDAVVLGPSKAEAFGNTLLARGAALGNAALTALLGAVRFAQEKLVAADTERDAATNEAATHELERRKLLREVERQADLAEVGILTAFPGERALVNAILTIKRERKKKDEPA